MLAASLRRALLAAATAAGICGCASSVAVPEPASERAAAATSASRGPWNVLVLSVDCLRPDHLSLYGYARPTSPRLDAFAQEALVFENAFATAPWTSPAIVSLLTGYHPAVHGQSSRYSFYDDALASPLRLLSEEGYRVEGRVTRGPTYHGLGFQREVRAKDFEGFVRALVGQPEPFFAWLHTKEPHLPYAPSAASAGRFFRGHRSPAVDAVSRFRMVLREPLAGLPYENAGRVSFEAEDAPAVRALYDETVLDADAHLGRAFAALRDTGLLERTIVVVTADHGEELLEHGWVGHASTSYDGKLYDELIRVPLVIRLPAGADAGRVRALVQTTDVMPSVLGWLDIDPDRVDPPMQGRDLRPLLDGRSRAVREFVFAQTTRKGWTTPRDELGTRITAVRSLDRKLIWWPAEASRPKHLEAYDLVRDPAEQRNLWPQESERFADLVEARDVWDRENREIQAALLTAGALKLVGALQRSLAEEELLGANEIWRRLSVLQRSFELEPDPCFDHPEGAEWRALRARAGKAMAEAIDCEGQGQGFRLTTNGDSGEGVVCVP